MSALSIARKKEPLGAQSGLVMDSFEILIRRNSAPMPAQLINDGHCPI
jgi:hypothetical protein